ncbi:hypothetical protein [Paenacidovorax monticola]|uniref:Uncharacterized protein n=1 Tax=Paenacidovorax monticola TaxID=1926868 RepID=A0A7H0HHB5_9BURK|nr:hypothetical protein [Paenacidovorax monticola]QNP59931.1 hypothetical protein H9L24_02915 [Paenacidovorax monticola]
MLAQQLLDLISSYQIGSIELNSLCFKSELIMEGMRSYLSSEIFSKAINCVYVLEEINALILDEARQLTQAERTEVEGQLNLLKHCLRQKPNQSQIE